MNNISTNKQIIKNSAFLFFRTLFIMGITLYTSRVVLNVLGINDYGIFNVVGGIASMLIFLSNAMVQASQRYISFSQGNSSVDEQMKVFSTSIAIHVTIAIIIFLLMETIGLWYVNTKVVLPPERLIAANVVFQFAIFSFLCRVIVVPYNASVIAHEQMHIYAYISMYDAVFQLILIVLLKYISFDSLIVYGAFMFLVSLSNLLLYYAYCRIAYQECRFKRIKDWSLYKEMFSFASWAFIGGFGFVARGQGVNLVINSFCGPAVNTARAVAYQVQSAILTFVGSFQQAINPQITKRFAIGEVDSMMTLVRIGSKYTFLALLVCCSPIIVRADYILNLWLGQVPNFASEFLILSLCVALITCMGNALNTAMQATGNIKMFQIIVSVIMCCDVPASYMLLVLGLQPYLVSTISIGTAFVCLFSKLYILRKLVLFDMRHFVFTVIIRNFIIAAIAFPIFSYISESIPETFFGLIIICFVSLFVYGILFFLLGLEKWEKNIVKLKLGELLYEKR